MDGSQIGELALDHADPVRRLLSVGNPRDHDPANWLDYATEFGIGPEHVEALIRMACDDALHHADSDSGAVWAPVHAWRALGQLRAEAAIEPLLELLPALADDDAADSDLPVVYGMIGAAAMLPISRLLSDRSLEPSAEATAILALKEIGRQHPECRDDCVGMLAPLLAPDRAADDWTNGFVVSALLDLHAVEAIEAIRDAFRRNAVELFVAGDVEDVEIELGFRAQRSTPRPVPEILSKIWGLRPQAESDRV